MGEGVSKLPPRKRMREGYNPNPSAAELRHHKRIMELPCFGCQREPCGVFHHLLERSPSKQWKRDHRVGIGLCHDCHMALHGAGSERAWRPDLDCANEAEFQLLVSINGGVL